jgi:integrase/recombinase XerD
MSAFVPCVVRPPGVVPRLDDAWLDEYLRFVAARARPNTLARMPRT